MSPTRMRVRPFDELDLLGMRLARTTSAGLLDYLFAELSEGRGGWIVTANLDILRRHRVDADARALYAAANLRVADGMPLVWASRIAHRTALPERIAGSTLSEEIVARTANEGRRVYLVGGEPGAAAAASEVLRARHPSLAVAGVSSPQISNPPTEAEIAETAAALAAARPDIVLVGLGSPKQEYLIHALRPHLPHAWMIGVGITFSFVAGRVRRAPLWVQRAGLEWAHRLAQEPGRLARRYLVDDLPVAFVLLANAATQRLRGR